MNSAPLADHPGPRDGPLFEPYDRFRHRARNVDRTMSSLLAEFARLRSGNLDELRSWRLGAAELGLPGMHPGLGPVTLRQLLAAWVVHDLEHVAQAVRVVAALLLLSASAAGAAAAPPAWLPEAVRAGSTKAKLDVYRAPALAIEYTTPFLRVARAANKAVREGRAFRPADVEAKAWVPELRILVGVLPVTGNGGLLGLAAPKSARLLLGAGEIKASRMDRGTEKQSVSIAGAPPREMTGGVLKAVFEVPGTPPVGGELEIRYAWTRDGREQEVVKRVPLDFRKTRW